MGLTTVSRRGFVAAAAAGVAGAALMGSQTVAPRAAAADETADQAAPSGQVETINCSGIVVDPAAVTEVTYTDVLVVGGGFSGLAAAVQAGENGDGVILIEAASVLGGNGMGVEGTFAVDSKFQKEQGVTIDKSIIMQEELGKPQWAVDGLYYKDLIANSAANIEWVVDKGAQLSGLIDNYPIGPTAGKVNSFHWWLNGAAGEGYVPFMAAAARGYGVDIRLNTRGLEFSYAEDGSVDGVYAQDAFGDIVNFKATAVILATGGFANDDKRLVRHGFVLEELERVGTPGHYGDAINMALAAGCSEYTGVCYLKYNRISHDYDIETFGPFWSAFCFGGPFLWLNANMERFVDEACALEVGNTITQSAPIHNQGCCCYSIFDSVVCQSQIDANREMAEEWGHDLNEQLQTQIDNQDDVWTADTIEGLAEAAGVDPAGLAAAVEEYNGFCEAGKDEWFGKPAEYLAPISTPPFYMTKIHVTMEGPLGGVKTDRTFRPMLDAGGVLENVFIIGLDGIMLYRDVYPMDVPGSASAECLNGGRVSANEAHALVEAAGPNVGGERDTSDARANAKQAIMAISDVLTTIDLGLTDEDSPATIASGDERFAAFYQAVQENKKMEGLELTDCSIVANISGVLSATARADSQQMSYHYTLVSADMTINGAHVTYDEDNGIVVG